MCRNMAGHPGMEQVKNSNQQVTELRLNVLIYNTLLRRYATFFDPKIFNLLKY